MCLIFSFVQWLLQSTWYHFGVPVHSICPVQSQSRVYRGFFQHLLTEKTKNKYLKTDMSFINAPTAWYCHRCASCCELWLLIMTRVLLPGPSFFQLFLSSLILMWEFYFTPSHSVWSHQIYSCTELRCDSTTSLCPQPFYIADTPQREKQKCNFKCTHKVNYTKVFSFDLDIWLNYLLLKPLFLLIKPL